MKEQSGVPVSFNQPLFFLGLLLLIAGILLGNIVAPILNISVGNIVINQESFKKLFPFLLGLIVTLCVGPIVKELKDRAEKDVSNIVCPEGTDEELWGDFIDNPKSPGRWIGHMERTLFYIIIWWGKSNILGAILVFKIAAKWEAWKNIVKIPDEIKNINELEFAAARRKIGAQRYSGLLIGTMGNILAALAGFGITLLFK